MLSPNSRCPVELLIVDDEPQSLKYFQKIFSPNYVVHTATNAAEAEEIVFSGFHDIGVIISDQRMPGKSGVNFLNRVQQYRPDIIRVLTTAYSDLDSAVNAVNDAQIFRYISKPWDLSALETDVEQAVAFYVMQSEVRQLIREKLGAIQRTMLRDRLNSLAMMSVLLRGYDNAPQTIQSYLTDELKETAWLPDIRRQLSQLDAGDQWRLPCAETQRNVDLTERLLDAREYLDDLQTSSDEEEKINVVDVAQKCASMIKKSNDMISVVVRSEDEDVKLSTNPAMFEKIIDTMLTSLVDWVHPGSTLLAQLKNARRGVEEGIVVNFEMRNFNPANALKQNLLHQQPFENASDIAVETLRAALMVGHLGGQVRSQPSENGFKTVQVMLPSSKATIETREELNERWISELNDEYDRWALGLIDIAS